MEVARLDAFTDNDGGEGAAGAGAAPVWVKYADGAVDEVEREVCAKNCACGCVAHAVAHALCAPCQVALISPFLRELVLFDGAGTTHEAPLQLPKQVVAACELAALGSV